MKTAHLEKQVELYRLLGDRTRFAIIKLLIGERREVCVNEIASRVGASHSATSHQLAKLEDRGIVCGKRVGQTVCYRLCKKPIVEKLKRLVRM